MSTAFAGNTLLPFLSRTARCAQSKEKGRENRDEAISRRPSLRFPFADRARHIGGKKAGLSFNWRTLSCKNKMRRSRNETSGIDAGMNCSVQQESARRCTYHTRPRSRGNTDLLTCVRERNAPAPTSYLLTGHPCNGELSSRRITPLRRGLTRTAPFRVGINAFF